MKNIFLSPHQDDAVLSCGGLIKKLSGTCLVITIFAGQYYGLTSWDRACHFKNGDIPWQTRNEEDAKALEILNAKYKHLDKLPERYQKLMTNERQIRDVVDVVKYQLKINRAGKRIYAPLGVSNEDHIYIRKVILEIIVDPEISEQYKLIFYEDFPYIIRKDWTQAAFDDFRNHKIQISPLVEDITVQFDDKLEAIMAYKSQIEQVMMNLFPKDIDNIKKNCRKAVSIVLQIYSNQVRPGGYQSLDCYFERYWPCIT